MNNISDEQIKENIVNDTYVYKGNFIYQVAIKLFGVFILCLIFFWLYPVVIPIYFSEIIQQGYIPGSITIRESILTVFLVRIIGLILK